MIGVHSGDYSRIEDAGQKYYPAVIIVNSPGSSNVLAVFDIQAEEWIRYDNVWNYHLLPELGSFTMEE